MSKLSHAPKDKIFLLILLAILMTGYIIDRIMPLPLLTDYLSSGVWIEHRVSPSSDKKEYLTYSKSVVDGTCSNPRPIRMFLQKEPTIECVSSYKATSWDRLTLDNEPNTLISGQKAKIGHHGGWFFASENGTYTLSEDKGWFIVAKSLLYGLVFFLLIFSLFVPITNRKEKIGGERESTKTFRKPKKKKKMPLPYEKPDYNDKL